MSVEYGSSGNNREDTSCSQSTAVFLSDLLISGVTAKDTTLQKGLTSSVYPSRIFLHRPLERYVFYLIPDGIKLITIMPSENCECVYDVCVRVCVVCMHVFLFLSVHVCVHLCACVCLMCVHLCEHVHVYVCTHV